MKLLITTVIASVALQSAFSQSFISEDKLWSKVSYGSEYGFPYRSSYVRLQGDSIVDDTVYKKVFRSKDEHMAGWSFEGLMRETDTGTVFYWDKYDEAEHLLYDFGWEVGERIPSRNLDDLDFYLDSIKVLPIGPYQELRKHYYFSYGGSYLIDTWVEGIGSLKGLLSDLEFTLMVGEYRELLCFTEGDSLKFINNECDNCFKIGLHPPPRDTWPYIGATWYFSEGFAFSGDENYCKIECVGDTIINGNSCRILQKNKKIGCNLRPLREYVYINDCKEVYFYDDLVDGFQKLYDFDAKVGDTWSIYLSKNLELGVTDTVIYTIDSISDIRHSDRILKQFHFSVEFTRQYYEGPITGSYIEFIGPTIYFFPWYLGYCDVNVIAGLRCYQDWFMGYYNSGIHSSCTYTYIWNSTEDNEAWVSEVFPNPANHTVTIGLGNPGINTFQIAIYDSLGRLVHSLDDISNSQVVLDVSLYDPGLYFYKLQNEVDRTYSSGQFVVE